MILLYNVLITDNRASASGMNRVDRLDLFKYALASFACIGRIRRVILYVQLDGRYAEREVELRDYANTLFPHTPVEYYPHSPASQSEWQKALEGSPVMTTDGPILYSGNDDHVFIDHDETVLYEGLDLMAAEPKEHINTLHFTSWTEAISTVFQLGDFKRVGRYWVTDQLYPDAIQIVNQTFFRHVVFDLDWGGAYFRRTDPFLTNWYPLLGDYAFGSKVPHPPVRKFVPLRELVRHFDAYHHVRVSFENCPMLDIPPGFFDRTIRIDYCGHPDKRLFGYYPWGPFEASGDRKVWEDLPLFWRSRIAEIRMGKSVSQSREMLLMARNGAHRRMMTAPHDRAFQRTNLCTPAVKENRYKAVPHDQPLPLAEEDLKAGERTV